MSKHSSPETTVDSLIIESPRYNIIIWNDNKSDVNLVTVLIAKVFNYSEIESIELTKKIHEEGNTIVWTGNKEVGEFRMNQCEKFKKEHAAFIGDLKISLQKS